MPGHEQDLLGRDFPTQDHAVSIEGLTAGVAFILSECCHPVPGDRIVGLRREGHPVEVHTIECNMLANTGVDGGEVDWIDLSWGKGAEGGAARLRVIVHNRPGTLAEMAGIFRLSQGEHRQSAHEQPRWAIPHL